MKDQIRNHVIYHWWKYLAVIIFSIVLWVSVFNSLKAPAPNQRLNITFVGDKFDSALFEQDLKVILPEIKGKQNIKAVFAESVSYENEYTLNTIIATRCLGETDLIVISESVLADFDVSGYFVPLTEEIVKAEFGGVETYSVNDTVYGIKLSGTEKFSKYYADTQNCYVFVTGISENFGALNGKGDTEDRVAISLIKYLTEVAE